MGRVGLLRASLDMVRDGDLLEDALILMGGIELVSTGGPIQAPSPWRQGSAGHTRQLYRQGRPPLRQCPKGLKGQGGSNHQVLVR